MISSGLETSAPKANWSARAVLVALVVAIFLGGAVVSYFGVQYQSLSRPETQPAAVPSDDPIVRIDLPYEEFPIPPGPSRERFQVNCAVCHSPRLVFTQPLLLEKKWQEVVHKMVAVYGAPLSPEEEREIVSYLSAVHGQTAP